MSDATCAFCVREGQIRCQTISGRLLCDKSDVLVRVLIKINTCCAPQHARELATVALTFVFEN